MADMEMENTPPYASSREFAEVVVNYSKALRAIELRIPAKVKSILVAHFYAPDRRLSVLEMAQIAGYKGSRAGSLQYGLLAGRLSEVLGEESPGVDKISIIGQWDPTPDARGHGGWVMYEELAAALEDVGWVSTEFNEQGEYIGSSDNEFGDTSRFAETEIRIGQDVFRQKLINYWESCAVTGCTLQEVLVASHMVPWSLSNDQERLDVFNGLLLIPNLDRLFDQHLISFEASGCIHISPSLSAKNLHTLGIHQGMKIHKLDAKHLPYLAQHFRCFKELNVC